MITKINFEKFTAFQKLEIEFSTGFNIFIGANGTGKTHVLKTIYSACEISESGKKFSDKLVKVFLPFGEQIGRLAKRQKGSCRGFAEVFRSVGEKEIKLRTTFSNHAATADKASTTGAVRQWYDEKIKATYFPVKEMLANASGFRALYAQRQISFEEIYFDIVDRALLPLLRGPTEKNRKKILSILQEKMDGHVVCKGEAFFLKNKQGELEFTLLAEGLRKLALIWTLIQNGTFIEGSVLCWDEPEANLNPQLLGVVAEILLELQRLGVQIFIATHDYVFLKELDMRSKEEDKISYHSLYRNGGGQIAVKTSKHYLDIHPNTIADTFTSIYRREIARTLSKKT